MTVWWIIFALVAVWGGSTVWIEQHLAVDTFTVAQFQNSAKEPSPPIECGPVQQVKDIKQRETIITCRFRLHRPPAIAANAIRYQNLFQTAAGGTGLRVEFGINPETTGTWALVFDDPKSHVVGILLNPFPAFDEWHEFAVHVSGKHINVQLDRNTIHDADSDNLTYLSDDVAVGSGYSKSRPFDGEISDFSIKSYHHNPTLRKLTRHLGEVLVLSLALVLLLHLLALRSIATPDATNRPMMTAACSGIFIVLYAYVMTLILPSSFYDLLHSCLFALASLLSIEGVGRLTMRLHRVINRIFAASVSFVTFFAFGGLYLLYFYWVHINPLTQGRLAVLNFDEIGAIYQSNPQEALGFFFSTYTGSELIIAFLCALATAVSTGRMAWTGSHKSIIWKLNLAIVGVALVLALTAGAGRPSIFRLLNPIFAQFQVKTYEFNRFMQRRMNAPAHSKIVATKAGKGETYIIVIGESANPGHMGAYGYFRPTTPWLSSNKADWLIFQNAYSSYCHTIPSLLMAMTSANQYNGANDFDSPSLVEVFKAAGFKTYWLSEQGVSWLDSPLNAIASSAEVFQIVRPLGRIPPLLDKTLATINPRENNLIIVHLIGSHAPYVSRIPNGYKPNFLTLKTDLSYLDVGRPGFVADILNAYDSSILFTDQTLSEIAKIIRNRIGEVDAFVYFSDHGEDVLGGNAHNASVFTYPMARIPLIIAPSPTWKARYPEKFARLNERLERVFTLDLLFELIISLADINTPLLDTKYDFSAPDYDIDFANALIMKPSGSLQKQLYSETNARRVADDPWLIAKQNAAFLSAHYGSKFIRNNADNPPAPFETARLGLTGVEINIAVPTMTVGHYPEVISDFPLDEWLAANAVNKFTKIWLDLKLIKNHALGECLPAMEILDRKYAIKQRSIVESWEPGLELLSDRNWHTSYYLYEGNWPGLNGNNHLELRTVAEEVAKLVLSRRAQAVSFHAKHYSFVKTYLEPLLPADLVYHTWALELPSLSSINFIERLKIDPIPNDSRVATVLIDQPVEN